MEGSIRTLWYATFCWGQLLKELKNYVENGIIIPHPERN
jgi:hypothetical protein